MNIVWLSPKFPCYPKIIIFFVKWFDKESTKFASAWSHEFKEKIQTVVFEVYSFEGNPVTWEGPLKDYSLQN